MKKFITLFISLFDTKPVKQIKSDTIFKEIDEWDSLVALNLIAMVSNEYKKDIDANIIYKCKTLHDLYNKVIK